MNSLFQILTLSWSLQGGMIPDEGFNVGGQFLQYNSIFITMSAELTLPIFTFHKDDPNCVFFSFSNEEDMTPDGWYTRPIQETYDTSFGLRWGGLEAGYAHECSHSVESTTGTGIFSQELFHSYDKIYAKISGKL